MMSLTLPRPIRVGRARANPDSTTTSIKRAPVPCPDQVAPQEHHSGPLPAPTRPGGDHWLRAVLILAPVAGLCVAVAAVGLGLVAMSREVAMAFVVPVSILVALAYGERAGARIEIRERASAEGRLRETSELLSAILMSSPVAIQAFDRERNVIVWNPASERTFGWTADEVVGRPLPEAMVWPEDRESSRARIARTMAGSVVEGERVRRLTKDGQERWIDIYAAPLTGRDGVAIGVAGQMIDVTERLRIEAQLAQAQKMGAVGLLVSGIAHDFNNTLAAAGGYAELIAEESDGAVHEDARALMAILNQGRRLTRQLLDFARQGDGERTVVDLAAVVSGIEPLIGRLIAAPTTIHLSLPREPLTARVQVGQLEQALVNLAVNARDAMPDGGRLTIVVRPAPLRPAFVDGDGLEPGDPTRVIVAPPGRLDSAGLGAEIFVSDEGCGMDPAMLASVFEPFYTTKPAGHGTGLGLAMVRGFVESAEGGLTVRSTPGRGTTFTIWLPRETGPATAE